MSEFIYEHVPSGDDATGNPVDAPTLVQREEIVRCRDYKHYRTLNDFGLCHPLGIMLADMGNGFCAWGERRAGE